MVPYIREGRYLRELLAAIFFTLLYRSLLFLWGGGVGLVLSEVHQSNSSMFEAKLQFGTN